MNLSLPVLTLCLFFGFFAQGQIYFSAPIAVAPDNTYGPRAPRIALVEGNRPLVYWGKPGNNATLYLARWEGTEFGEPMALSTGNVEPDLFSEAKAREAFIMLHCTCLPWRPSRNSTFPVLMKTLRFRISRGLPEAAIPSPPFGRKIDST